MQHPDGGGSASPGKGRVNTPTAALANIKPSEPEVAVEPASMPTTAELPQAAPIIDKQGQVVEGEYTQRWIPLSPMSLGCMPRDQCSPVGFLLLIDPRPQVTRNKKQILPVYKRDGLLGVMYSKWGLAQMTLTQQQPSQTLDEILKSGGCATAPLCGHSAPLVARLFLLDKAMALHARRINYPYTLLDKGEEINLKQLEAQQQQQAQQFNKKPSN